MPSARGFVRVAARAVWVVLLAVFSASGFLFTFGVWGFVAADGPTDPTFSIRDYLLLMAGLLAVTLLSGGLAAIVHRRLLAPSATRA